MLVTYSLVGQRLWGSKIPGEASDHYQNQIQAKRKVRLITFTSASLGITLTLDLHTATHISTQKAKVSCAIRCSIFKFCSRRSCPRTLGALGSLENCPWVTETEMFCSLSEGFMVSLFIFLGFRLKFRSKLVWNWAGIKWYFRTIWLYTLYILYSILYKNPLQIRTYFSVKPFTKLFVHCVYVWEHTSVSEGFIPVKQEPISYLFFFPRVFAGSMSLSSSYIHIIKTFLWYCWSVVCVFTHVMLV